MNNEAYNRIVELLAAYGSGRYDLRLYFTAAEVESAKLIGRGALPTENVSAGSAFLARYSDCITQDPKNTFNLLAANRGDRWLSFNIDSLKAEMKNASVEDFILLQTVLGQLPKPSGSSIRNLATLPVGTTFTVKYCDEAGRTVTRTVSEDDVANAIHPLAPLAVAVADGAVGEPCSFQADQERHFEIVSITKPE